MAKNIVFCADGTWNGMRSEDAVLPCATSTNVVRLYASLKGQVSAETVGKPGEQEKAWLDASGDVAQVAKYLHGVGDTQNALNKLLGGVFGEGFIERIVRGYTFLSRHYEPGDRLYLVGFSRGAYTVRSLAGMVVAMGLLPVDAMQDDDGAYDADLAYRRGLSVWIAHRRSLGKASTLLGYLDEFKAKPLDGHALVGGVAIEAVAVWDTVGALGIPLYAGADPARVDVFQFADRALSPRVRFGLHAIAIDEEREDFVPTLWDPRDGVVQRWFAGAHADVGGGYPSQEFSAVALRWMHDALATHGLAFDPLPPCGDATFGPVSEPYARPPFDLRAHAPRVHPDSAVFHTTVQDRLDRYAGYQPASLARFLQGRRLPTTALQA